MEILGRITTMTRRNVATPFDDPVSIPFPPSMLQAASQNKSIYQKNVPLGPGTYRLSVVAKDVVAGNVAVQDLPITVPRIDADKLSASSVVLADIMEHVPLKSIGTGMFVLGDTKVRPRLGSAFKQDEKIGIYVKLYNFAADENSHKPNGSINYELTHTGSADKIFDFTEDLNQIPEANASQITLEKFLSVKDLKLTPGSYTLRMKVLDRKRNQTLPLTAQFTVT
jgi:hypothetical protein